MLKKLTISLLLFSIIALSAPARADSTNPDMQYDPLFAIADVILLRPLGLAGTIVGSALFVGLSPITALAYISPPHDAFSKLGHALVVTPALYTFDRPVGVKYREELSVPENVKRGSHANEY